MKAIKIDIQKELIELNKPYYDEVKIPRLYSMCAREGEMPPAYSMDCEKIRYELKTIYNNLERKNYLVKLGEKDIFNELLEISNSSIRKIEKQNYLKGEIYWLRLWVGWLKSNKIKRFLFKKQIISVSQSLEERELDLLLN